MKIPLIDLSLQVGLLKPEISEVVTEVLFNGQYILGPNVKLFENEVANYLGVKHAISVANGTDALIIALKALGVGINDEVIVPSFTFFATAEAVSFVGATPVFIDVDKYTYNIDVQQIEEKITSKTKAILPVHLFGQSCQIDVLLKLAEKYNLYVIEDCAQSIGASYIGQKTGSFGDFGTLSFFPTKNLGCAGDGGMLVTNNDELATIALALRAHGSGVVGEKAYNYLNNMTGSSVMKEAEKDNTVYDAAKYYNYLIGHNSRLDEIQAAILRLKLPFLDQWNKRRKEIALRYNEAFRNTSLIVPYVIDHAEEIYHLYILQSENREALVAHLNEKNISSGIYYPVPLHLQKAFKDLGYQKGDLPVSEYLSHRTFAIPVYPELSNEQVEYIIQSILEFEQN